MTFLPIVSRELRAAARRRGTYRARVGAAGLLIAITGLLLPVFSVQSTLAQGRLLFTILSTLGFAYCLLAGVRITSDILSVEKREGTIGLLFLTDLKGYDVVLGKLVSSSVGGFYSLLAIVPVLALALLIGGVTLGEVGRVALLLADTLFLSLAAGLFVSALSRDERKAMYATLGLLLLITCAPFGGAVLWALSNMSSAPPGAGFFDLFNPLILLPSPAYAYYLQFGTNALVSRTLAQEHYACLLTIHLLSWVLLLVASLAIRRLWRERPEGRLRLRGRELWQRLSYGRPASRRRFRAQLLDRNAFYWLAARDRLRGRSVWLLVGAFVVIWLWGWWWMPNFMPDWDVSLWLLFVVFLLVKVWLASEVCMRFVADRQCGALELVLCTPLGVRSIVHGQNLALWRQFGRPVVVLAVFSLFLLWAALRANHLGLTDRDVKTLFLGGLAVFLVDLQTLKWVAMRRTLSAPSVNRALTDTIGRVLLLPWVLFGLWATARLLWWLLTGRTDLIATGRMAWHWTLLCVGVDLLLIWQSRTAFYAHFRQSASLRFSPAVTRAALSVRGLWRRRAAPAPLAAPVRQAHAATRFRPRLRRVAIAAAALVLLAAAWFAWERHSLTRQVDRKLASIRLTGQPVSTSQFRHSLPGVPEKENAAIRFQRAQLLIWRQPVRSSKLPGPRKVEWPGRTRPLTPEEQTALADLVARNERALSLIHEGADLSRSRYPVTWGVQWGGPWEISRLREQVDLLQLEALLRLETGRVDDALASVEMMLRFGELIGQDPYFAAQYTRRHACEVAIRTLERILTRQAVPDQRLEVIAGKLHETELATLPGLAQALTWEECEGIESFSKSGLLAVGGWGPAPSGVEAFVLGTRAALWRMSGKRDRDLVAYLDAMQRDIRVARMDLPALLAHAPKREPAGYDPNQNPGPFAVMVGAPSWDRIVFFAELAVHLQAAQVGLAIERYRAAHGGRLPDSLSELAPAPMSVVPDDPFLPGPLHYAHSSQGCVVYSVGRDGHDDGGVEDKAEYSASKRLYDLTFKVERERAE